MAPQCLHPATAAHLHPHHPTMMVSKNVTMETAQPHLSYKPHNNNNNNSSSSSDLIWLTIIRLFSGASTVAIDNKIEQAMDLVKSHLMFAVREEVEVLKEQIKELLEKNNQLEYENSILKANASQETLSQIQSAQLQRQPDTTQPPTSKS